MAKEILFVCDPCAAEGKQNPATHVGLKVQIGSTAPLLLDVCAAHHQRLVDPMIQTLAKYGYRESKR